jgi:hypothetical protein
MQRNSERVQSVVCVRGQLQRVVVRREAAALQPPSNGVNKENKKKLDVQQTAGSNEAGTPQKRRRIAAQIPLFHEVLHESLSQILPADMRAPP